MSIWDDIRKICESIIDYTKQGIEYVIYGINMAEYGITYAAEQAWKHTSEAANTVGNSFKELGITISQGVVDGVNTGVAYLEKAKQAVDARLHPPPPPDQVTYEKQVLTRAIGALFMRMAQDGEEYDLYRLLSIICDEKRLESVDPVAYPIAERIGSELHNIPYIGRSIPEYYLIGYIWYAIYKAAHEKPENMGGGKAGQVIAGLVSVLIPELVCENKVMEDFQDPQLYEEDDKPYHPTERTVWPEGSRISVNSSIYLVLDGKVRHIPGPEVFNGLFANWDVIESMPHLQTGSDPLTADTYLVSAQGDGKVYLVCDGVKRWISSPQVFKKYNFNSNTIRQRSKAELEAIPTGDTLYNFTKKEGSVLRMGSGAGLYLLLDKKARPIPNQKTFNQLFVNWDRIQEVNLHLVTVGEAIDDGAHLASADGKAYFINGEEKRWIMNPIAFNSFNFDWNKIRKVQAKELEHLRDGMPIY